MTKEIREVLKLLLHDREVAMLQIEQFEKNIEYCKSYIGEIQQAIQEIEEDYGLTEEDINH